MKEGTRVVLDFSGCRYIAEMHMRLKESLLLPEYYGQNWDALLDFLLMDSPVEYIEIRGEEELPKELKSILPDLHDCLDIVKERCTGTGLKFDYRIVD